MHPHTEKLSKLLNMLASDNEHERAVVALKIATLASEAKQTVTEFVQSQLVPARMPLVVTSPWDVSEPVKKERSPFMSYEETTIALRSLKRATNNPVDFVNKLDAFEMDFATDLLRRRPHKMTERQLNIVERILYKLRPNPRGNT